MKIVAVLALLASIYSCSTVSDQEYHVDDSQGSPICEPKYCPELRKIVVDINYSQQTDDPAIQKTYLEYVTDWISLNRNLYPDYPKIVVQEELQYHFFYYPEDLTSKVFIRMFFYDYGDSVVVSINTLSSYMMYSKSFLCGTKDDDKALRACIGDKIKENLQYIFDGYRYNMKISKNN